MSLNIKVCSSKNRYGYIRGEIDNFYWYALVHKEEVEFGLNPNNLSAGQGRVSRLCVYKDVPMYNYTKRLIYANYKRQWEVFNSGYEEMIRNLVEYLDRRYSIRVVK
ncbi:hypothetical protein [Natronincola ferrireducens]|uniref:Uncharacterized protein n=1 Tax=Natronincola ferrireducens TaxID=393762 RepID=A0A1G8ZQX3_9FIRM|nr:hypothetical protein [Natronincola ferrireducens]SDK17468.1 hypothetical protein SAMN05660472_00939 [Natronincola ferrireducens]